MSAFSDAFLSKARESLAGAESEFANARYNNVINRAYDASFQAAVAALDPAQIRPTRGTSQWGHRFVQGQFAGQLIGRRKVYRAELGDIRNELLPLRDKAVYQDRSVSQRQAARALARARTFVGTVAGQGDL